MGIKGLNRMIKKIVPDAIKENCISDYNRSSIAIDSNLLLYKFRYGVDKNLKRESDNHIFGFLNRVCYYLKNGILPIFIWDGKPPHQKSFIHNKRSNHRKNIRNRIKNCEYTTDSENLRKLKKQIINVTRLHHRECKYLLKLIGIPSIVSSGEAEALCAHLQKEGHVTYTYTEDTDALTFGAPLVLRKCHTKDHFTETNLSCILQGMGFSMEQFVDFCILCGCDYCPTIPKIGPSKSYNMVKRYETIENIVDVLKKTHMIPTDYIKRVEEARIIFSNKFPENYIEEIAKKIEIKEILYDNLKEFFITEKEYNNEDYSSLAGNIMEARRMYLYLFKLK